ncbi:MAG TPA: GIY-YIG nuclease family protein, partial [Candidatus Baltobacteraceae bacterium]|nr:GIY-YIG nuclease family protein [Candidatus Baltobacteraceae bacterium]
YSGISHSRFCRENHDMDMFVVYMVECRDGSYYTGVTNDADRRVAEHNAGIDPHSYTFTRRPVRLVYSTVYYDPSEAIRFEKQLKGWSRKKKQALIRGDWKEIVSLSREIRRGPIRR